jgi:multiple sugar transport system permease protein
VWTAGSVILQLLLGFIAALALEETRRLRTLFRVLLIIPWAFPAIVMTFVWRWMVDGLYGVLNYVLLSLGLINTTISFFGVPQTALPTGIAMNVWFGFPFMMVSLLAGLQTIPREHYEVAIIEGASYLQRLRYVVLPAIKGVMAILVVLRTIWVFNNFDFLYLTTGGGPGNLTQTLPIYAFRIGWLRQQVGRMAAVAILMIIVLAVITVLYFRLLKLDDQEATQ